jgi:hypothetical protein
MFPTTTIASALSWDPGQGDASPQSSWGAELSLRTLTWGVSAPWRAAKPVPLHLRGREKAEFLAPVILPRLDGERRCQEQAVELVGTWFS